MVSHLHICRMEKCTFFIKSFTNLREVAHLCHISGSLPLPCKRRIKNTVHTINLHENKFSKYQIQIFFLDWPNTDLQLSNTGSKS